MNTKEKTNTLAKEEKTKIKFPKKELKMPEEHFGRSATGKQPSFLGITLGLLILALMVILGGLYLWSEELQKQTIVPQPETPRPTALENNEPESNNAEAEVETMQVMSTSDEINAIQADLESTNLDTLTNELITIDAALQE